MKIKIDQLELLFSKLIMKLKEGRLTDWEIDDDYYRIITTDRWADFTTSPDPAVGSLFDDWESLLKVCSNEYPMTFVDFDRLASIVRYIGEYDNPTSNEA